MSMTGIQNNTATDGYHSPSYWAWHPIIRGLSAGVITEIFSITTPFPSGLIYGGISGFTNIAFRPICRKIDEKIISPEAKATNYLFSITMPWAVSAAIMRHTYKATGNALFRISPAAAVGTAVVIGLWSNVNDDLLESKNGRKA